jgi:hypothetical protein
MNKYDASKIDYIMNKIKRQNHTTTLLHQIIPQTKPETKPETREPIFTVYFTDKNGKNDTKSFTKFVDSFSKLPLIRRLGGSLTMKIILPLSSGKEILGEPYFWNDVGHYVKKHEYLLSFIYIEPDIFPFTILYYNSTPSFLRYIEIISRKQGLIFTPDGFLSAISRERVFGSIGRDILRHIDSIPENERNGPLRQFMKKHKENHKEKHKIWARGKYNENCNTVCSRLNKKCISTDMRNLRKTQKMRKIAKKTGVVCKKMGLTKGPPFVEDYGGKGCWVSDGGHKNNHDLCSIKSSHWNTNICSCESG